MGSFQIKKMDMNLRAHVFFIVDDEPILLELAEKVFERHGV